MIYYRGVTVRGVVAYDMYTNTYIYPYQSVMSDTTTGGLGLTLRAFSLGAIATSFIGCFLSMVEEFNEFLRSMKQVRPCFVFIDI